MSIKNRGNRPKKSLMQKININGGIDNYRFLYTIPQINQYSILKNGWYELDIIDIAILYAIINFINSGKPEKTIDRNNREWYWICEEKIMKDMPLLPLNSTTSVSKRIDKLIKYDLIERCPSNKSTGKKMIALGMNVDLLHYTKYE